MKQENLKTYELLKVVPQSAQKEIKGGRLKGKTNINPMWRIKALTELYGTCGTGWYTKTTKKWTENGGNSEITAHVDILLFVKSGEEWSQGIEGTGGSMLVEKERNGLYTCDEAYKMAYTDALSVACKALGMGAEIYWEEDKTKYDKDDPNQTTKEVIKLMTREDLLGKIDVMADEQNRLVKLLAHYNIQQLDELSDEDAILAYKALEGK